MERHLQVSLMAAFLVLVSVVCAGADNPDFSGGQLLWYEKPASHWMEALPLGNGRLGAMVYGDPGRETIQLNIDSLWDGYEGRDQVNPRAKASLPKIRELLFSGRTAEAKALLEQDALGIPPQVLAYQTLGELRIEQRVAGVKDYRRALDLDTAIHTTVYSKDGVAFRRTAYSSAVDDVLVVTLEADQAGAISVTLNLDRPASATTEAFDGDQSGLQMQGRVRTETATFGTMLWVINSFFRGEEVEHGPDKTSGRQSFAAELGVRTVGGTVQARNGTLVVENADRLELYLAAASDMDAPAPEIHVRNTLRQAMARPELQIRADHIAEYQSYYRRVSLDLAETDPLLSTLPTDQRLKRVANGGVDVGLESLYFQFGRYLLISSSRPGTQPANLQGIWNKDLAPFQGSAFIVNINTQMNYWPAQNTNLAEMSLPLFDWLEERVIPRGEKVATQQYGARGWVLHHLTDIWGRAVPAQQAVGVWPFGGAWLSREYWEYYQYSGDKAFLRDRAYPVLKGASLFLLDFLLEAPADTAAAGYLVTAPSNSPENYYVAPDGTHQVLTYGATMDFQIIRDLFGNTLAAMTELGLEQEEETFRAEILAALRRLPPLKISQRTGGIQEWIEDYKETEIHHRHFSHLYGLYPASEIDRYRTPDLAAAADTVMTRRLEGVESRTGWTIGHIVNLYGRLGDGDAAHHWLGKLLTGATSPTLLDKHLFYHPGTSVMEWLDRSGYTDQLSIFFTDGNMATTAAMAEWLLQSQAGEIRLLPALPSAWPEGRVRGLRARGGFEVSMRWQQGTLAEAVITSMLGHRVRLRSGVQNVQVFCDGKPVPITAHGKGLVEFDTAVGRQYIVSVKK